MKKLLAVSCLVVSFLGCGSDDKDRRGELHVASIVPKTGTFSSIYQLASGTMSLCAKIINDAGGILGNDIVFDEYDEAGGTNGTAPITAVANTLVENGTQVWVGPYLSDSALVAGPIAGANSRLLISTIAASTAFSTIDDNDFAFRGLESPAITAVASARIAYASGHRTAAALHQNFAAGNDMSALFLGTFAQAGGTVQVNQMYNFDPTNPAAFDPQPALDVVFAGNPDVIYLYGTDTDALRLLTAWNKSDWNGQLIVGLVLASPELAAAVGPAKLAGTLSYTQIPTPANEEAYVVNAFADVNGFSIAAANLPIVYSVMNSTFLGVLAIEAAGENDGTKARDALRGLTNAPGTPIKGIVDFKSALDIVKAGDDLDYQGLTSPIEFDGNGDIAPAAVSERRFTSSGSLEVVRTVTPGIDF